jgi:predicted RNase H-like nuclease
LGISQQSFGILAKLNEVDCAVRPDLQARVFEVHPELCFLEMAGGTAARHGKKRLAGRAERRTLLAEAGLVSTSGPIKGASADDVLDALAACWTARRIAMGLATRVPETPPIDSRGLRMEIWR